MRHLQHWATASKLQSSEDIFLKTFKILRAHCNIAPLTPITVALSGGSDSLALIHLCKRTLPNTPLIALTVDHKLRAESASEAARVAQWMQQLGVEHHVLNWHHAELDSNLQAKARNARYQLLDAWCNAHDCATILTGHTQDDQAETIALMHQRGASAIGLSGMSAIRKLNHAYLIRPLLNQSRNHLQIWLKQQQLDWITDPSNQNTAYARIRLRNQLAENPEQKTKWLRLGQEMSIIRQNIETAHRDFCQHNVAIHGSALQVNTGEWIVYARDTPEYAAYSLGQILRHVSGRDYAPRYQKLRNALAIIQQQKQSRLTLARCFIDVTPHNICFSSDTDNGAFGTKPLVTHPFTPIY